MKTINKEFFIKNKNYLIITFVALLLSALNSFLDLKDSSKKEGLPPKPTEILIPKGHVLIPIDVQNIKQLDSLFGKFGFINLYSKGQLIARNLRALRTDQESQSLSLLITEQQTQHILNAKPPFFASLQSKNNNGTEFVSPITKPLSRLILE